MTDLTLRMINAKAQLDTQRRKSKRKLKISSTKMRAISLGDEYQAEEQAAARALEDHAPGQVTPTTRGPSHDLDEVITEISADVDSVWPAAARMAPRAQARPSRRSS
jgi:hypothetical protein